jgi:hypothetical protein
MKFKVVFLFILISIKINCQLSNLNKFYSENLTKNHEKNIGLYEISVYKIKGEIYETDGKTFFSLGKEILYKNMTSDLIYTMIYDKRYLFIGHYSNTKEEIMKPTPYWVRLFKWLEVIDLEDKSKKWTYKFNNSTNLQNIQSFNPKDGDIVYCNHKKPEKNTTE